MKRILRWPLPDVEHGAVIPLRVPAGTRFLCVDVRGVSAGELRNGAYIALDELSPCVWGMVDDTHPDVTRRVHVFGTGGELPPVFDRLVYLGTFQDEPGAIGAYVWHVFVDSSEEP